MLHNVIGQKGGSNTFKNNQLICEGRVAETEDKIVVCDGANAGSDRRKTT